MSKNKSNHQIPVKAAPFVATIICLLAATFYIYDYFIQVSPSIMKPQLMAEFHIDAVGLSLLGSCFYYAYVGMQIPAGLLLDRFGARKLLSFAVFISALGVTLFAKTHSFYLAGFARLLVGFGSAFSLVSALYLIANWFSHRYFACLSGLVQFGACVGAIVGLAPLAIEVNHYGWRDTLDVVGLFTLLLAVLYWVVIRDGQEKVAHTDQQLNQFKALVSVMKSAQVWWVSLAGFCCWAPIALFGALWGVPYLIKIYNMTNTEAGWWVAALWIGVGLGSPFIGWFSDNISSRKIPFYICFASGLLGGVLVVLAPSLSLFWTVIGLFLVGFAGSIQSLTFGVLKDLIFPRMFATASGFVNMLAALGGGFAQLIFGFILNALGLPKEVNGLVHYTLSGYQHAMLLMPLFGVLGFLITYHFIRETRCKQQYEVKREVLPV